MAGGAAKALAAPHAGEMRRVIEQDVAEQLLAREESPLVTDQAGGIVDLGPGIGAVRAGELARDHREGFVLLPELVLEAGWDMALDAGDVVMRRLRPGFEIRLHDMARAAEVGPAGHLHGGAGGHDSQGEHQPAREQEDLETDPARHQATPVPERWR